MEGRYGYRRITELLRREGWRANHKRVERLWREECLKVPSRQPKRRTLWFNDGSCVRLRPAHANHVYADFAEAEQLFHLEAISCFGDGDHPNRSGATLAGSMIDQLACSVNAESFFLIDSPVIPTL